MSSVRFWISHLLLLFFMVGSGIYYLVDTPAVAAIFTQLGYPTYTLYFNAAAKILGGLALVMPLPRFLKEFAYAGYLYIILLATQAVWMTMPGIPWLMFGFIAIWLWAYSEYRRRA
jgi:uncharacterized membrane protein